MNKKGEGTSKRQMSRTNHPLDAIKHSFRKTPQDGIRALTDLYEYSYTYASNFSPRQSASSSSDSSQLLFSDEVASHNVLPEMIHACASSSDPKLKVSY